MITLIPETASLQYFRVRTRPAVSQSTVTAADIQLLLTNAETNQEITLTPATASYDEYGFLDVTAVMYVSSSQYYNIKINQLTGSSVCTELYRGEIYGTEMSPVVITSEPLQSYTGSNREQILNEYIIY